MRAPDNESPAVSREVEPVQRRSGAAARREDDAAAIRRPGWMDVLDALGLADGPDLRAVAAHDVDAVVRPVDLRRDGDALPVRAPQRLLAAACRAHRAA